MSEPEYISAIKSLNNSLLTTIDLERKYNAYLKKKLGAIKAEIITYHRRDNKESTAWFTIELIEKILSGSYFTTNNEEVRSNE